MSVWLFNKYSLHIFSSTLVAVKSFTGHNSLFIYLMFYIVYLDIIKHSMFISFAFFLMLNLKRVFTHIPVL